VREADVPQSKDPCLTHLLPTDFHIFFERPPLDQGDRWSARPFRHFAAVRPTSTSFADLSRASSDKQRFLRNLWTAQAVIRSKVAPPKPAISAHHIQPSPPSVLLDVDRWTADNTSSVTSLAQTYWNVWDARSWASDPRKVRLKTRSVTTSSSTHNRCE
jgi:hypothetical protein